MSEYVMELHAMVQVARCQGHEKLAACLEAMIEREVRR
jgi:hypothetical protein